jgi:glyoxylase-like metal-dependent hydrolase (beta-lactamase superfamily II)
VEDWASPGAYEVSPGVHRIPLPLPEVGLRAVNVYVVAGPSGLVAVDAGWATAESRAALSSGLHELGYGLDDVAQFIVTHAHWDHYTQAIALRASFGSRVRVGRGERYTIEGFDRTAGRFPAQVELLRQAGATELASLVAGLPVSELERSTPFDRPDAWLDDGEKIVLGDRTLEVFATPGHTRGHVVLRDLAAGVLFAGDHVLPTITPSLGLELAPEPHPLRSYLDSLRLVRDQPDLKLLPAHGPVTPSVHVRVDELIAHHEQRLEAAAALVAAGRDTAASVAAGLPWTRRARRLDEMDVFNQMLAVLETEAHLDVLAELGQLIEATDPAGIHRYQKPAA